MVSMTPKRRYDVARDERSPPRRRFLAAVGGATTVGLAGCFGSSSDAILETRVPGEYHEDLTAGDRLELRARATGSATVEATLTGPGGSGPVASVRSSGPDATWQEEAFEVPTTGEYTLSFETGGGREGRAVLRHAD